MLHNIKLSLIFLLLFSNYSSAYEYLTSIGGPGVTINRYFVHNGGGLSLLLNENIPRPSNCTVTNHVYIKPETPGFKIMASAALAAFAAGKKIGLHGDGCELLPFWGGTQTRPIVTDLWVFQ